MSDMTAKVTETANGIRVEGYEELKYGFEFVDDVFNPKNLQVANVYKKWGRCLLITDRNIESIYGDRMRAYFEAHDIALTLHVIDGGEIHKVSCPLFTRASC